MQCLIAKEVVDLDMIGQEMNTKGQVKILIMDTND